MLDVFRDGFDARVVWDDGVEKVEFATSSWRLARRRFSAMFGAAAEQPEKRPQSDFALIVTVSFSAPWGAGSSPRRRRRASLP